MNLQTVTLNRLRNALIAWLISLASIALVLFGTNPDRVGPVGVTLMFGLIFLFCTLTIHVFALLMRRILARPSQTLQGWRLSYSLVLAFLPTIVLALQSLDQLVLRDVLIFTGLASLLVFYIVRRSPRK